MSRPVSREGDGASIELAIESLGAAGDGIARLDGRTVYVPWTLPGERVRARRFGAERAVPDTWIAAAPDRVPAACPHFTRCGGCALQHLPEAAYRAWKVDRVRDAVSRAGFDADRVGASHVSPPRSRRRATFAAVRTTRDVVLGFHAPMSRDIVAIDTCAVLEPALEAAIPPLRAALADVLAPGQRCDLSVTATLTGLDLFVVAALDPARLRPLSTIPDLARLSLAATAVASPILVAQHRAPAIRFGATLVHPPPQAFLQATRDGEEAIVAAASDGIGMARRVADLYAGCGTIALRLAERTQVLAIDSAAEAIAALDLAARSGGLGPRIRTAVRDLDRRPLVEDELRDLDAVVFDPPRAGARSQAEALARSAVPRIVAVSCNPTSFARDARVLREGGCTLEHVTPIDQFLWSPHVELVAVFSRPKTRRRG